MADLRITGVLAKLPDAPDAPPDPPRRVDIDIAAGRIAAIRPPGAPGPEAG